MLYNTTNTVDKHKTTHSRRSPWQSLNTWTQVSVKWPGWRGRRGELNDHRMYLTLSTSSTTLFPCTFSPLFPPPPPTPFNWMKRVYPTLFPAYIKEAEKSVPLHSFLPIERRQHDWCTLALFFTYPASITLAGKSVGVHSFLPIIRGMMSLIV